ncbi:hypothetical protein PGT21_012788 [Puccinia graminis f. sp. tritici]|uniref:Core-binding (CB) domain-containing protein n=1 Tax=Puccinia graminis f. sp. tritici TaxID=56615 RepID=A0A5B0QSW7_PUCGR|nr:hypothetical protein PGT21_012788 [Puccinia graminis f. sp. tritici]
MKDFTSTGFSLKTPSKIDKHVMNGWRSNTLRSYNSAVRKFLKFAKEKLDRRFELPATHKDIIGFCYWAGRNEDDANPNEVSGATLTKYLHGMKAWHTYHGVQCPYHSDKKVALMIKASLRADALATRQKAKRPVMVELVSMNWISSANQLCQTQPAVHKDFRKFAHRPIDAACTMPTYCMSLPLGSIGGGL